MTCDVGDGECVDSGVAVDHCGDPSADCNLFIAEVSVYICKRIAQLFHHHLFCFANSATNLTVCFTDMALQAAEGSSNNKYLVRDAPPLATSHACTLPQKGHLLHAQGLAALD